MGLWGAYISNLRQWDGPGSANGKRPFLRPATPFPWVLNKDCRRHMAILFYLVTKNKLEIPGLGFDYVPEVTHGHVESVIGGTDTPTCTAFHADYKKEFMKVHRTKWNLTRTYHRCLAVGYPVRPFLRYCGREGWR
jgi:hypothetical protein